LLIQAGSLLTADGLGFAAPALELAERALQEQAGDTFLSQAHYTIGQCLRTLRRFDEALSAYRLAFEARRSRRGMGNLAHLDFAWLVLEAERADLYDEALQVLDEFEGPGEMFPANAYRNESVRALMWARKGDRDRAATHAKKAIAASSASASPFRHHRQLGLVKEIDLDLQSRLLALAASQQAVAADGASPRR
jgi:tetratricopeptide (TPR) repeat protein